MSKIKDILGQQGLTRCSVGSVLALLSGLVVLCMTMVMVAWPAYGQLQELWEQRRQQKEQLLELQQFAAQHADYKAYEEAKYKELVQLKQGLQQLGDSNQLLGRLQLLSAKQGLALKNMQVLTENKEKTNVPNKVGDQQGMQAKGKSTAPTLTSVQLKLELAGDYFGLLRWLKQVEKLKLAVQSVEIKGQKGGIVSASLVLRCPILAL
ncbi:MAG: hypothetical protein ACI3XC_00505 [Phascolarctobacterium sp.]